MGRGACVINVLALALLLAMTSVAAGQGLETLQARAQGDQQQKLNAVYLEVLGNGGAFSLNYERMVTPAVGVRAGVANWSTQDSEKTTVTTVPLTVSYVFDGRFAGMEVGGGLTLGSKKEEERPYHGGAWLTTESQTIVDLAAILGYRWVRPSGWLFRVAFTPFLALSGDYPDSGFFPSVGLTVGRVF